MILIKFQRSTDENAHFFNYSSAALRLARNKVERTQQVFNQFHSLCMPFHSFARLPSSLRRSNYKLSSRWGPPASAGRDLERKALCCHYHSFRSVHKLFMMTRERKEWFSGKYLLSHLHESTERFSGKERLGFKIRTHLNFIDFPTKVFEARGLLTLFLLQTRANCRTQNNFVGDDDPL